MNIIREKTGKRVPLSPAVAPEDTSQAVGAQRLLRRLR